MVTGPNPHVRHAVSNALDEMLKAGAFKSVCWKQSPGRGTSYDVTEYNRHHSAFVRVVDHELKACGFINGVYQKDPGTKYQIVVSEIVRKVHPVQVERMIEVLRNPGHTQAEIESAATLEVADAAD